MSQINSTELPSVDGGLPKFTLAHTDMQNNIQTDKISPENL